MNERISKIAQEADAWCDKYYFGDKFYDIEWEKKFAELIVRECLDQCYNRGMNDELYNGQLKAAAYIEQHFGVEE
jgi:hypothetical protein